MTAVTPVLTFALFCVCQTDSLWQQTSGPGQVCLPYTYINNPLTMSRVKSHVLIDEWREPTCYLSLLGQSCHMTRDRHHKGRLRDVDAIEETPSSVYVSHHNTGQTTGNICTQKHYIIPTYDLTHRPSPKKLGRKRRFFFFQSRDHPRTITSLQTLWWGTQTRIRVQCSVRT